LRKWKFFKSKASQLEKDNQKLAAFKDEENKKLLAESKELKSSIKLVEQSKTNVQKELKSCQSEINLYIAKLKEVEKKSKQKETN
jgi:hypothetical protein